MQNKICLIILFSIFFLSSCKPKTENQTTESDVKRNDIPESVVNSLTFDSVKICPLENSIRLTGVVDFNVDKVSNIYPLVSGTIHGATPLLGDYVNKGQILGTIKSAEMANYGATLANAETNLRLAAKTLEIQKSQFSSGIGTIIDVTNAQANYDQAVSSKIAAERVLNVNGNNSQGEFVVQSPISGFIVQKNVTSNMVIRTDNGNPMFTISDLKEVWVQANVYEGNISKIHLGDKVDVTTISYPDKIFKGRIDKLLNVLDPSTKVMKVRIVLPNDNYLLKTQMFVNVTVSNKEDKNVICVSDKAIVFDNSQYFVIVAKDSKNFEIRKVQVLSTSKDKVYIISGLAEGEKVVTSQALLIYNSLNS